MLFRSIKLVEHRHARRRKHEDDVQPRRPLPALRSVTTTYLPVAIKAKLRTDARQRIREAHLLTKGAQLAVAEDTRK